MTDLTLTVERTIKAAPEKVFDAWLRPEMLQQFMLPGEGMTVPKASNDPREGGRFELVMQAGDQEIPHAGTYHKIDPHNCIVFGWESPFSTDGSTVTLDFKPVSGGTHLTLTHVRFPDVESRDNHAGGWGNILAALDARLAASEAA
ncbi:SRPBCC family protein [Loktanella sp. Alg231-35]|uniref:SRPBCC family protein n=1 Tax=Loktanella sp. Alg231-35 TaxID=1922220 RepID=UPI000D552140|nr:SRPBCC domain-containing protein [Loktanella sp. Alg231-35]